MSDNSITPIFDFEAISNGVEAMKFHADTMQQTGESATDSTGLFLMRTANTCMAEASARPIPKMLFSEFWYEGEICILFADTNVGKSILAVQIADSISRGVAVAGFHVEATAQTVLYFDFEISDKQFEGRYSQNYSQHYSFDNRLFRIEISRDATYADTDLETYLCAEIERVTIETGAKVLIIDNLTFLRSDSERAKDAAPLMKQLKALQRTHGVSVLVLAHTPKRDTSKPITINDLAGSKMLGNFCDSAFAIGASATDKSIRYLKQIKQRNGESVYDSENVAVCELSKPTNFLGFTFLRTGNELEYLKQGTDTSREELAERVQALHQQGKSFRNIANELGVSLAKVQRTIAKVRG